MSESSANKEFGGVASSPILFSDEPAAAVGSHTQATANAPSASTPTDSQSSSSTIVLTPKSVSHRMSQLNTTTVDNDAENDAIRKLLSSEKVIQHVSGTQPDAISDVDEALAIVNAFDGDFESDDGAQTPPTKSAKEEEPKVTVDLSSPSRFRSAVQVDTNSDADNSSGGGGDGGAVAAVPLMLDSEATPAIQVPAKINVKLREYQREGIQFLYKRYKAGQGAILGDDMGMGKTVQTIGFLAAILRCGEQRRVVDAAERKARQVALIVLPASVIAQWEKEIKKWSALMIGTYQGAERARALARVRSRHVQVLLISYEMLRTNREVIDAIDWSCIVFDEMHRLKNARSKVAMEASQLRCMRRVGLTGTLMQNNFDELYSLVNFVSPHYLGTLRSFRSHFVSAIVDGQEYSAKAKQVGKGRFASRMLAAKLKNVMLRRKKDLIAHELPGKEDNVVFCDLTPVQERIYERALNVPEVAMVRRLIVKCSCGSGKMLGSCCGQYDHTLEFDSDGWRADILRTITRLNNISNHPVLLTAQARDAEDKRVRDLKFQRAVLAEDEPDVLKALRDGDHAFLSGKMRVLEALLRDWRKGDKNPRVLLFSRSTRTLDMLSSFLRRLDIRHLRLDGSTPQRQRDELVKQFQRPSAREWVFLVSTRAGGLGLNLTAANIVVVFDPNWNQTWDLQAQDRAYRIGQQRYTRVYRFIAKGTLEELLYVRQIYKQQFANIAQEATYERRYFNREELFGLSKLLCDLSEISRTSEIIRRTLRGDSAPETIDAPALENGEKPSFRIERERVVKGGAKAAAEQPQNALDDSTNSNNSSSKKRKLSSPIVAANGSNAPSVETVLDEQVNEEDEQALREFERRNNPVGHNKTSDLLRTAGVGYMHSHQALIGNDEAERLMVKDQVGNEAQWREEFSRTLLTGGHTDSARGRGAGGSSKRRAGGARGRGKKRRHKKKSSLRRFVANSSSSGAGPINFMSQASASYMAAMTGQNSGSQPGGWNQQPQSASQSQSDDEIDSSSHANFSAFRAERQHQARQQPYRFTGGPRTFSNIDASMITGRPFLPPTKPKKAMPNLISLIDLDDDSPIGSPVDKTKDTKKSTPIVLSD